jgi:septal ring factor EnvC (AmiA/AmiB activator)
MMEKNTNFNALERKVLDLLENYQNIKQEIAKLEEENKRLKNKLRDSQVHNLNLMEDIKRLKVVNAMSGNQEYKEMMKLKMNKLIKEVDSCIAQIKTNN